PPARHRNGVRVLGLDATGADALVTQDALGVVPHVERVVDLDRLVDGLGEGGIGRVVVAGHPAVPVLDGGCGRTEPLGLASVLAHPFLHGVVDEGHVDRGGEEFEDDLAGVADPLRVGGDHHPVFDLAGAGGDEGPAPLDLDHAHPADVDGGEGGRPAQRGLVFSHGAARLEDRRPLRDLHRTTVDGDGDLRLPTSDFRRHSTPNSIAERTTDAAVWPKPQIEASFMATSSSSMSSASTVPLERATASSTRTVPTRQGTHWPHDPSRKNWAMRRMISFM